jgi:hypothetical protein
MLLRMHAGCKLLLLRWLGKAVVISSSNSSSSSSKQAQLCTARKRCVLCLSRLVLASLRYDTVTMPSVVVLYRRTVASCSCLCR